MPLLACVLLAVASLPIPTSIGYDPWAWLVWGREVGRLDLVTTGGPSWKPFPVLFTTVFSFAGDLAPQLWLIVPRAAGLITLVAAWRLGVAMSGRVAGWLGAALVVLTPDDGPRFLRVVAEGHVAPLTSACALWALERHLAGSRQAALVLLTALSLMRPEAWPILLIYAVWLARTDPTTKLLVFACFASIPLLWFGGDYWGSGSPWHGAGVAQVNTSSALDRLELSLRTASTLVVSPVWIASSIGLALAVRNRDRVVQTATALAAGWILVVVAMATVLGYAALSRFMLAGAALFCVLGAVGVTRALDELNTSVLGDRGVLRGLAVAVVALASLPFIAPRVASLGSLVDEIDHRTHLEDALDQILEEAGGTDRLAECATISYDGRDGQRPALAWRLDVPMRSFREGVPEGSAMILTRVGTASDDLLAEAAPDGQVLPAARSATWAIYTVGC